MGGAGGRVRSDDEGQPPCEGALEQRVREGALWLRAWVGWEEPRRPGAQCAGGAEKGSACRVEGRGR